MFETIRALEHVYPGMTRYDLNTSKNHVLEKNIKASSSGSCPSGIDIANPAAKTIQNPGGIALQTDHASQSAHGNSERLSYSHNQTPEDHGAKMISWVVVGAAVGSSKWDFKKGWTMCNRAFARVTWTDFSPGGTELLAASAIKSQFKLAEGLRDMPSHHASTRITIFHCYV